MDNVFHLAQVDSPTSTEHAKPANLHAPLAQDQSHHVLTVLMDSLLTLIPEFAPAQVNVNMAKFYQTETVLEFVMIHLHTKTEFVYSEDVQTDSRITDSEDVFLLTLLQLDVPFPPLIWMEYASHHVEMDFIQIQTTEIVLLANQTVIPAYQEVTVYRALLDLTLLTDPALPNLDVQQPNSA